MMAQSAPFTVLVAALLNTLSYSFAGNVYCVTPMATLCSSCPQNSTHCATLSEYAHKADMYFISNTTMVFLPGDHVFDRSITVANIASLTMCGESFPDNIATIARNGSVGFSFTNLKDIYIYSLAFTSYNKSWNHGSHSASNSALLFESTQHVTLVNCSFHHNLGTALAVHNTSITLAENNEFMLNKCGCESFTDIEKCKLGCGITALNSTLTFAGNTTFLKNNASFRYSTGAIWASTSSLYFTGTNNFIGNTAVYDGGAVYAQNKSLLSFNGSNNFNTNCAHSGGAITTCGNVKLTFNGINTFINNLAIRYSGGAIYAHNNVALTFSGTNNFVNNSADWGGAIHANLNTITKFVGTNIFSHNSAVYEGGAIYTEHGVVLTFNGTNNFFSNFLHRLASIRSNGGAIFAKVNTSLCFNGTNNFSHNWAESGGAIYTYYDVVLTFRGNNNFINNSAIFGGVIFTRDYKYATLGSVTLTFNGTNNFINNSANYVGGAIHAKARVYLRFIGTNTFSYNSADFGGAIHTEYHVKIDFNGNNNFFNNSALYKHGGAIFISCSSFTFNGTNNFSDNLAKGNGGAFHVLSMSSLRFIGTSTFNSNSAFQGGAIISWSRLDFSGKISFINNGYNTRNSRGGALYLPITSTFYFSPNTTIVWKNNQADFGGAIHAFSANPLTYCAKIATYVQKEKCFFQVFHRRMDGVKLIFKNNSANTAGSVLYGGAIDNCKLTDFEDSGEVFDSLAQYEDDKTTSSISSDPFRICPCKTNRPNCMDKSNDPLSLSVYPGETFQVSVVSTGQRNGIVPAVVRSYVDRGRLLSSQYIQQTAKMCTTLNYTVFSDQNVTVELYADGPCSTFGDKLIIQLNVNQTCPPGFDINQGNSACVCNQALQKYTNHCNVTNGLGQITRVPQDTFWVGYDQSHRLALHPYCPFDYCVNDEVVFPLNNADIQCAFDRSGLLCGACNNTGYSLILGSSHCKLCTNIYLLLLIPFALMGVALVFLLLVCKLTTATGLLSGLLFYANIVGVNHTIFLPVKSTGALSIFIAWLNLDFGIETCFYNGMDAYSKTWLQFVFPVYIWVLVGLIILFSHFSQRFANLLGSNPVSVLATLILLSYAKVLRTFITAVSFLDLHYQYHYKRVWLHDANIEYLVGKRIPLFLVSVLVFLFLFLPYTILLLLAQWLQAISHLRLFSWANSAWLKPFMDSYHAPYKAKHRYWPGLLLVLRCVLLLVFALNPQQDTNISLPSNCSGSWDSSNMGLGQWWDLQELVSRCTVSLIYSELDHTRCCHLLC